MALMKFFTRFAPSSQAGQAVHDTSFGLTADPMIQFAAALSALVNDVDHSGVPNSQLVKEKASTAVLYNNVCVAEQNALKLAWTLLMSSEFVDLRRAIYSTEEEFHRFRQLMVNSVLATDIFDKDLQTQRKNRWNSAFADQLHPLGVNIQDFKATLVLEHIVQAADIVHAMQHWQIYQKWNQRLYQETYQAYKEGRGDDPATYWYDAEIGFFDDFVAPLAKNLKESGMFGASGDEYLGYAMRNRREWVMRGKQVVEEMNESFDTDEEETFEQEPKPDENLEISRNQETDDANNASDTHEKLV
jgi:hypothetical protein